MGHAKELITMDVYADNREIIADGVPEIEAYMEMVLPNMEENELFKNELLEIVVDVTEFLPETAQNRRTDVCLFCTFESVCGIVDAERLLSMAVAKCLQAVTWLVAFWYTKVQCLSPFYMVCSCFVHIELHGYGRLQKKQIVNGICQGPIFFRFAKIP